MEKIVNDIYSECEEKLTSNQIDVLISNLEDLSEIKYWNEWIEAIPSEEVARENCQSII